MNTMDNKQEGPESNIRENKLLAEIDAYNKNIDQYLQALQTESVWLFLAVLGCWSVSSELYLQTIAFSITLVFFGIQVNSRLSHKKTFDGFEREINDLIERELVSGPLKKYYQGELKKLQGKRLSKMKLLKTAPMFVICFAFFALSFFEQVCLSG